MTRTERQYNVDNALASARIEGFEPDAEYLALLARYVNGELTMAEVGDILKRPYQTVVPSAA